MTRLLLITEDNTYAQSLQHALSAVADFQIHHRPKVAEARGGLTAGAFEVCLLAPAHSETDTVGDVAAFRAQSESLPLVVVAPNGAAAELLARLLSAGADSVLNSPVDMAALGTLLVRLAARGTAATGVGAESSSPVAQPAANRLTGKAAALSSALEVLRDFSQVLGYSLDYRQLTQHFLLKLREVVGLSRIAIFLEPGPLEALPTAMPGDLQGSLPCAAAVGVPADLVECFALTRKSGLGRLLTLQPQILRAPAGGGDGRLLDQKVAREFEVLGGQVALAVNDRERTLGVAVLGGRITGGEFSDEELLLVYHLLEELGLAVKNSWLHRQAVSSQRLFASVLDGLSVGALVVGSGHHVLYANRTINQLLRGSEGKVVELVHLPAPIAVKLHEAIERGTEVEPFYHEAGTVAPAPVGGSAPPVGQPQVWRVSIVLLRDGNARAPRTALLLMEDFTGIRVAQRAEIESSNLRLISLIARRFAHEIRNALVPLSTHAQLFESQIDDAEFQRSLKSALDRETQRIQRFTDQMLVLARAEQAPNELADLEQIIRQGFEKSLAYAGGEGELEISASLPHTRLRCNPTGLAHAFQEIFLNGLQSSVPGVRRVQLSLDPAPAPDGRPQVMLKVRDSGIGFSGEAAAHATEPFYTTRNTGVGLGLTIARRVIEAHQGSLEVHARTGESDPDLVIRLPLSS